MEKLFRTVMNVYCRFYKYTINAILSDNKL